MWFKLTYQYEIMVRANKLTGTEFIGEKCVTKRVHRVTERLTNQNEPEWTAENEQTNTDENSGSDKRVQWFTFPNIVS